MHAMQYIFYFVCCTFVVLIDNSFSFWPVVVVESVWQMTGKQLLVVLWHYVRRSDEVMMVGKIYQVMWGNFVEAGKEKKLDLY